MIDFFRFFYYRIKELYGLMSILLLGKELSLRISSATYLQPTPTKKIREVVAQTKCSNVDEWKEKAYATFAAIPPVKLDVKIVLQDLYIGSLRSLTHDDFHMLKEKDVCFLIFVVLTVV